MNIGEIGEHLIQERYKIKMIPFSEDKVTQRDGIDGIRGALTHEVKTRNPDVIKYWFKGSEFVPDIMIETVSVRETNTAGWIYTSKADILFYGVLDLYHKYFMHLWRLDFQKLRGWWKKQDENKYPIKIAHTKGSHSTENRVVPFRDIPRRIWRKEV